MTLCPPGRGCEGEKQRDVVRSVAREVFNLRVPHFLLPGHGYHRSIQPFLHRVWMERIIGPCKPTHLESNTHQPQIINRISKLLNFPLLPQPRPSKLLLATHLIKIPKENGGEPQQLP
ncbi:hypothetical protein LIER_41462 [Lithospermum erythrorhizon]|uniref:Uncharacterized protein n=1 Tax=Lithospermum erythrorhizon TaxID=34254 RepID=A0AAV3RB73_LITER